MGARRPPRQDGADKIGVASCYECSLPLAYSPRLCFNIFLAFHLPLLSPLHHLVNTLQILRGRWTRPHHMGATNLSFRARLPGASSRCRPAFSGMLPRPHLPSADGRVCILGILGLPEVVALELVDQCLAWDISRS